MTETRIATCPFCRRETVDIDADGNLSCKACTIDDSEFTSTYENLLEAAEYVRRLGNSANAVVPCDQDRLNELLGSINAFAVNVDLMRASRREQAAKILRYAADQLVDTAAAEGSLNIPPVDPIGREVEWAVNVY